LLIIEGRAEKDYMVIEVSDNGEGMEQEALLALQKHLDKADEWDYSEYRLSGVALVNIQKRIRGRYGEKYGLALKGGAGEGLSVAVCLPYIRQK